MNSVVPMVLSAAALAAFVTYLWYFCQTIRVMWGFNFFIAIAAIFTSPLMHIVFYFFPKDGFDKYKKDLFKKYFLSLGAIFILGIIASMVIPAMNAKKLKDGIYDDKDGRQPWEWIIRSERLE